jgi:spore coat protein U-like protein
MTIRIIVFLLVVMLNLFCWTQAFALTTSTTFTVNATVAASCSVSGNTLNFGAYDPTSGIANDNSSMISVTCTNGTPYNVGLNADMWTGATVATRKLTDSTGTINYTLYKDSGRTNIWGQTIGTDTATNTGNGAAQALTVYGRIASGQNATTGSYADTITVTVTF